jgi:hypothetical protein
VDPAAVFKENGIDVCEGIEVKRVENTDKIVHFILPPPPRGELSQNELYNVAGGASGPVTDSATQANVKVLGDSPALP